MKDVRKYFLTYAGIAFVSVFITACVSIHVPTIGTTQSSVQLEIIVEASQSQMVTGLVHSTEPVTEDAFYDASQNSKFNNIVAPSFPWRFAQTVTPSSTSTLYWIIGVNAALADGDVIITVRENGAIVQTAEVLNLPGYSHAWKITPP